MKATADLCDLYEDKVQILPPIFRHYGGKKSVQGSIATIKVFDDNTLVRQMLEQEGLGRVLVVDGQGSMNCALLGDQLAELAIRNGWIGVLVNGCIRDSATIANMPIAILARSTHPRKSHKEGKGEVNVELSIDGIKAKPGYYLYADEDGVVVSHELLI